MKEKMRKNKYLILSSLLLVIGGSFFVGHQAHAGVTEYIILAAGSLISGVVYLIGQLLGLIISLLIWVAQYNNFITSPAVESGWTIVRDLANMFFIVILLIIAFATILRREEYSYKKLLPKLLIMAVLINFSKLICGIFIDVAQIVMLTFVSAFKDMGGANLLEMLGVTKILQLDTTGLAEEAEAQNTLTVNNWTVFGSFILALIYSLIALVVVTVMLFTLVMRMVFLWIYIVLSPLAYVLSAFPAGQKYSSEWWSEFSKNVIVGPVLAFFIWLSFSSIVVGMKGKDIIGIDKPSGTPKATITYAGDADTMIVFIIGIGMLIGGLMTTQKIGGAVGSIAGKGMSAIQKGQALAWSGAKMGADFLNRKQAMHTGVDLNPSRQMARIHETFDSFKKDDLNEMKMAATRNLRKGGLTGAITGVTATDWGENYLKGFMARKGIGMALKGNRGQLSKLRKKAATSEWKAQNVTDNETMETDIMRARQLGDTQKEQELINKRGELQKNGALFGNKKEAEQARIRFLKETEDLQKTIHQYTIQDYEGKNEIRAIQNEERKKITSTNEDELIADFQKALAHGDANLAAAVAKALVPVGGFNSLLNKFGYHSKAGLNEKEIKTIKSRKDLTDEQKEEMINSKKGTNDFMRDVFAGRLGMDNQTMLALQNDLAGLAESNSHAYLQKTVNVDEKTGEFIQVDEANREKHVLGEHRKGESEKFARNMNRLYYGGETVDGKFEWSQSGLMKIVEGIGIINKELDAKRFNQSAARAFIEPMAFNQLKQTLTTAIKSGLIKEIEKGKAVGPENADKEIDAFMNKLTNYANSTTPASTAEAAEIVQQILKKG